MKQFGLIGEKLGHSHSKTLHGFLADYAYDLWPMPPEAVDAFLKKEIGFTDISTLVMEVLAKIPVSYTMDEETVLAASAEAKAMCRDLISRR